MTELTPESVTVPFNIYEVKILKIPVPVSSIEHMNLLKQKLVWILYEQHYKIKKQRFTENHKNVKIFKDYKKSI